MRRHARLLTVVAAVGALALACAAPALSAQDPVISQCSATGQVTGNFTLAQLRHALQTLSPTQKEYTNCYDAINRAIALKAGGGSGNGGSGGSSGGSFLPTPLLILLIVLVIAAGAYGVMALRRQGLGDVGGSDEAGPPPPAGE